MKYLYRHRQPNDWIPHIWFISGTDGQWGKTPHPISIQAYGRMDSLPPEFLHGLQAQHTSTWPSHRFCLDSLHFVRPICGRIQAITSGRYVGSPHIFTIYVFCKLSARESKQKKYVDDHNFDLVEDDIAIVNGAFFFQIGKNKMIQEARIAYGGLYWCTLAIKNATETALKNKAWCQVW